MSVLGRARQRLRAWLRRHSYSFFSSLGQLLRHRVETLMTVVVLGIAILLPLGLHVVLLNLDRLDLGEAEWGTLTVFTGADTTAEQARALADALGARPEVAALQLISPDQGLEEFRAASGFGPALELLEENPLPWVLSVTLAGGETGLLEGNAATLSEYLAGRAEVASVQYDLKWLQRLARIIDLGHAAVTVLTLLFALAVVVVVANTIRLDVATRAAEIEVLALVGATPAFIRLPFLYTGFWYGLLGGVVAMVLANLALEFLDRPFGRLLDSYGQRIYLHGPGARELGLLLLGGALLGLGGAWISVSRHLRALRIGGRLGRR